MKIVFSSLSGYGHAYPLLPLALAAREVGHDVIYAIGERFHPLLQELGFRTVPVGMPIHEALSSVQAGKDRDTGDLPWRGLLDPSVRAFSELLPRRFAADLMPVLRAERPDLVVYEAGNPGAGLAAHRLDIPAVCHANSRADAVDREDRWRQVDMELLRAVAAEIGVEVPEGRYLLGDPYLDVFPASLQETSFLARPERLPLRLVPFSEPGELPKIALAERKRPLVYLTLGTVLGTVAALRAAVDGLSALDVEVVVAAWPNLSLDEFGVLPENVHLERWVPQGELLSLVDLAVHHGGPGTTISAAAAGVPQLFLPVGFDNFAMAGAVSATGAGRQLLPEGVELEDDRRRTDIVPAAAIAEAAGGLLADTDAGQAAKAIAEEIAAMPSPTEVASRLPEFC
ncbi:glycosyl transferase [Amycolatopsis sp. WAC 01375]|uniref:glycosyltransferase n=1 Tax=Amycolatopsis sp. WAC 01375 TaxID=2203194 RepID=UPI000F79D9AE|nr:glycosyltransferase [Amycolatopsis sp. WAC 01375]RSM75253.1 glycosyl transferase [Amycolatopsis sp. WAC 01375]